MYYGTTLKTYMMNSEECYFKFIKKFDSLVKKGYDTKYCADVALEDLGLSKSDFTNADWDRAERHVQKVYDKRGR